MPAPNISPPMIAPDHEPGTAIIRASSAPNRPSSWADCTQTIAVEKHKSHTATRGPMAPRPNSTVAARRQNAERCAAMPKITPQASPIRAAIRPSPTASSSAMKSMPRLSVSDGAS